MNTQRNAAHTEVKETFTPKITTIQSIFEIAKSLDKKFESQISFYALYFHKTFYEAHYEEYFDWKCSINHDHVKLIPIVEILNLVIEIVYLIYNRTQLTTTMILVFTILKALSIFIEIIATLHHLNQKLDIISDYLTYLGIAIGNCGIPYMIFIEGFDKIKSLNNILFWTVSSQYFLAIYSRSKTYLKSMILFSVSYFSYTLISNANIFQTKDYELIQLGGFIALGLIFHIYIYYINKWNRRSFYYLFRITKDLKYHQAMIDDLPLPIVIYDKKSVQYINKP